jgi:hypothetical protein
MPLVQSLFVAIIRRNREIPFVDETIIRNFAAKERNNAMFYYFPSWLGALVFLAIVAYFLYHGAKRLFSSLAYTPSQSLTKRLDILQLDVRPVSDGDEVFFVYCEKGKFKATIRNKRKHAELTLEAYSKKELEEKVNDTFRAWAITGKKKAGQLGVFIKKQNGIIAKNR